MTLPIDWDTPPAVCGPPPYYACAARPLYPHTHLLPTGEYFMCAAKCGPASPLQRPHRVLAGALSWTGACLSSRWVSLMVVNLLALNKPNMPRTVFRF